MIRNLHFIQIGILNHIEASIVWDKYKIVSGICRDQLIINNFSTDLETKHSFLLLFLCFLSNQKQNNHTAN